MSHRSVRARARRLAGRRAVVLALALLASAAVPAQSEDPGSFSVESASQELIDGVYYINAMLSLRLSTEAANALRNGLPLTIRVEVELMHRLRLWWDPTVKDASRRSQLRYSQVTDRYIVLDIDSGQRSAFKTLGNAMESLGHVRRLKVVDADELDPGRRYELRLRAVLDKAELPGVLALAAFWRRDWSIASDWWQWRLDIE